MSGHPVTIHLHTTVCWPDLQLQSCRRVPPDALNSAYKRTTAQANRARGVPNAWEGAFCGSRHVEPSHAELAVIDEGRSGSCPVRRRARRPSGVQCQGRTMAGAVVHKKEKR